MTHNHILMMQLYQCSTIDNMVIAGANNEKNDMQFNEPTINYLSPEGFNFPCGNSFKIHQIKMKLRAITVWLHIGFFCWNLNQQT